jgi:hypothetical protein
VERTYEHLPMGAFLSRIHLDLASEKPLSGPSQATFLMLRSKEYSADFAISMMALRLERCENQSHHPR